MFSNCTKYLIGIFCCFFLFFSFVSCKKKAYRDSDVQCKLIKTIGIYSGSSGYDTAIYSYTNDRITKVSLSYGVEYHAFYDNGRLSRIEFVNPSALPAKGITLFYYNPDGTLQRIFRYWANGIDTTRTANEQYVYSNSIMTKIHRTSFNKVTNTVESAEESFLTWSNENLVEIKSFNTLNPPDSIVQEYSYDNKLNYYHKVFGGPVLSILDPYYFNTFYTDGFSHLFSKNNLTGFPGSPSWFIITYTDNQYGLPEAVYWAGDLNVKYYYDCQ